jgi:phosphate transport system permease protein
MVPEQHSDETRESLAQQVSLSAVSSRIKSSLFNKNLGDLVFENTTRLFAVVVLGLILVMAYEMVIQSIPSMKEFGFGFISSTEWDPVLDEYGALPYIMGTLYSSLVALVICLPLSVGVAVFLSEYAPKWLEQPLSLLVELLAAIPSIVYGLFGIFILIPWLRNDIQPFLIDNFGWTPFFEGAPYGFSMLAAAIILSIMILPIITSISRDVMKAVPDSQREASYALGATKWETIRVVLKGAKSGILGATLLGLGRAIGETMAVTMLIGNRAELSWSLIDPAHTMASVLANEFAEASSTIHLSALIEIALILFIITMVLNAFARLVVWSVTRKYKAAAH